MAREEIEKIKSVLAPVLMAESRVAFAYLFGSRATGKIGALSDYDIAIFFDEPDAKRRHDVLFRLAADAMQALGSDAVDMHSLNDLDAPELKFRIIHEGVLLFEREGHRLIIEPRILNEYFDFTYLLRKYGLTKQLA